MVLNMANFVNSCKSLQTLWNSSASLHKSFVERFCRFREFGAICRSWQNWPCSKPWAIAQAFCSKSANFRRIHPKSTQKVSASSHKSVLKWFVICASLIRRVRKLADFEQKAWAIAHGFEHGRFCQLLQIAPNSLKRPQNRSKMICDCLRTVCVDLGWIRKGRKLADFEQKAWAIAHGFEHGQFCQLLQIAPNSLKRLQNRSKMICDCLRYCLWDLGLIRRSSKIGRFRAKGLGYSPWFWTWPILSTPANRSKLSETSAKPFKMICDCLHDCLCRFRVNS